MTSLPLGTKSIALRIGGPGNDRRACVVRATPKPPSHGVRRLPQIRLRAFRVLRAKYRRRACDGYPASVLPPHGPTCLNINWPATEIDPKTPELDLRRTKVDLTRIKNQNWTRPNLSRTGVKLTRTDLNGVKMTCPNKIRTNADFSNPRQFVPNRPNRRETTNQRNRHEGRPLCSKCSRRPMWLLVLPRDIGKNRQHVD